jgi:CelD/BcsL family acetyltransferase involved in cellulose biosynthesis
MKVTVLQGNELTTDHVAAWSAIQRSNPLLASPFLCPEFTQTAATVRRDVEVAVLEEAGAIVGFFPYERRRWNVARPVAARLNDFQAVICHEHFNFDPKELIRRCGLWGCEFDYLLAEQSPWQPFHWERRPSPWIGAESAFDDYLKQRALESRRIQRGLRHLRKLEREHGPLRFEFHSAAPEAVSALFRWKSEQYRRTGVTDVFGLDWTVRFVKRLLEKPVGELSGRLSALWTGQRLAAVHLGLRLRQTLHSWFPAYNTELAKYSPGLGLFVKLVEHSPACGIERIDLGAGLAAYKDSLATGVTTVARASLTRLPMLAGVKSRWRKAKVWVRTSPLRVPARIAADWTRPLRGWLSLR